MLPWLTLNEV